MGNQRASVLGAAIVLIFLLSAPRSNAADVPVVIVDAINARADEGHKLQSPIIDASPAMTGVYIYFMINTSDVPGYVKGGKPYMLDAHLIFYDENHVLHDVLFDRYVKDDGVPEISSVFFVNAGRDQKIRRSLFWCVPLLIIMITGGIITTAMSIS